MWYFAWTLGMFLVCSFGVITTLAPEHAESDKAGWEDI